MVKKLGKLIVVEGLDGSGKSTQIELLKKYLSEKNVNYKQIKLPNYDDASSALVKMYLNGDFGNSPDDVNAFAASSFYAVDRFASYQNYWKKDYIDGTLILADRYTTSNVVHQTCKLARDKWDSYLEWLYDFEFNKIKIPKPDLVLYFDMRPDISQKLMSKRYNGDEAKKDIHERDLNYLLACREAALYAANRLNWKVVTCFENDELLTIEQIFNKAKTFIDETL